MDLGLRDRTVLVTGASSGVGLATTRMLLVEGANVVGCGRNPERLEQLRREMATYEAGGGRLHTVAADVTDEDSTRAYVDAAAARFGGIDAVVCNAGRSLMATIDDTTDKQIRDEFELKIFGALNVIRSARPHLAESEAASIVVVNAVLARQPEARLAITSSARAALLNLTRSLTQSLGVDGIRINSVLLGLIDTGQWTRRYEAAATDQSYAGWTGDLARDRGSVLGRLGTADEVAWPILSLLSPLSAYTTGAAIAVDGGVSRYL